MLTLSHNGIIDIAIGKNRHEKNWKNRQWEWSDLIERFSDTHRTTETYKEYLAATKTRQDEIKDIGGYVGGHMNQGRRKSGSVTFRQLITLDVDYGELDFWDNFCLKLPYAAAIHSTHKHSKETPKFRLVLPLDRAVGAEEYAAISRKIAGIMGIEMFDPTTFQPERLMHWPSTAKDGRWFFDYQDEPWIIADEVLAMYEDWTDTSEWPLSSRAKAAIKRGIAKQGEPTEKRGIVGSFCRTYSLSEALEKFLPDVYERCDIDDRYTFIGGSTAAGLVIYEDKFAYSHHGTDPISGKLVNAFDLVRLHRFEPMDDEAAADTPINRMPSFTAMAEFAGKDEYVRKQIGAERFNQALEEFSEFTEIATLDPDDDSTDWLKEMEVDEKGKYTSTINNVLIALECDPNLKGKFGFNEFDKREIAFSKLPWRNVKPGTKNLTDTDDAGLRHYIERVYGVSNNGKIKDALDISVHNHAFHPIKDYFKSLKWDGKDRISTFLPDYMGVENSAYVKAITRKMLVAAVTRIYEPGTKFDFVLTLVGKEGVGKSQLFARLGRQWFSDSFNGVQGKEAFEQLQGAWIIEVPELAGLKKADADAVKHFIGKTIDKYRVAYGKRTEDFPRQCVFVATTNDHYFLVAINGNRRFWPVTVFENEPTKSVFKDLTEEEVNQIWAQALVIYAIGDEDLCLSQELEEIAFGIQSSHVLEDDRIGIIEKYLDTLLPENWEELSIYDRRAFLQNEDPLTPPGTVKRTRVCMGEIWCEALGGMQKDVTKYNTKSLHELMRKVENWGRYKTKMRNRLYGTQITYVLLSDFEYGKTL
jgi:predicted P-loop ATPase